MGASRIESICVKGLWSRINISWASINPDVNIIVGVNGSGKSTLLNMLWLLLNKKFDAVTKEFDALSVELLGDGQKVEIASGGVTFAKENINDDWVAIERISPYEIAGGKAYLDSELDRLLVNGEKALSYHLQQAATSGGVQQRLKKLYAIVDKLFERTSKFIEADAGKIYFRDKNSRVVQVDKLSSGEKHLLIILLKVFLMDEKPYILLMDEPEVSLHIDWQFELINVIRELNPSCQLIVATHSPSIFGDGWSDKVVFMDDLQTDYAAG